MEKYFLDKFRENTKKRLFITTGGISLVNAQAVLQTLTNTSVQNFCVIYTGVPCPSFEEYSQKLILPNFFEDVIFISGSDKSGLWTLLENFDFLVKFDEIYATAQYDLINMFHHPHIELIEEGISSYFHFDNMIRENIKNIFLSEYLNKLKHQDEISAAKVTVLNKQKVKDIIYSIRNQYNIDYSFLKRENQILLLGQYLYQDIMSDEEIIDFYKSHIDILLEEGYSVLFKSHPRVKDNINKKLVSLYEKDKKFSVFPEEIGYPVELIIPDLDLKAVIASMSGGVFNVAHLFNIPCYGFGEELMNHPSEIIIKYREIFQKYLPPLRNLVKNYTYKKSKQNEEYKDPKSISRNTRISVVLPTYNGERWLAESIESILQQTEKDWELIIIDDGSKDKSLEIAHLYAQKDTRIRVFSNETNKNLPASLNIGFSYACGKYFTWTSDDNLYKPEAFEVMANWLDKNPDTDMVACDMDFIDEEGKILKTWAQTAEPRHPIVLGYASNIGACFMYTKEIANRVGKYDESLFCAEDYDYWCRIALTGKIAYIEDNLYQYRRQKNSLTDTKRKEVLEKRKFIQNKYINDFFIKYKMKYIERSKLIFLINGNIGEKQFRKYWFFLLFWKARRRIVKRICYLLNQWICIRLSDKNREF